METVSFIRMDEGTADDYILLARLEEREHANFADRMLGWLHGMDGPSGYQISRLQHCLQVATRAERAGEDDELVMVALLHDIGDVLGPANHSEVAAAVLRPYVSDQSYWIVKHHGLFQEFYYFHHHGGDRNARERFRDHAYFQATVDFCERYDQVSFDPKYDTLPLSHFEPRVRKLFSRAPRGAA